MKTALKRFIEKYFVSDSGCWLWIGATGGVNEYGQFYFKGKIESAHRMAYQFFRGPVPAGAWVLHECDVPRCVNPNHLFLGTHMDNMKDMVCKGRSTKGEKNPSARLTKNQIGDIRGRLLVGERQKSIAMVFGVTQETISYINTGKIWQ